MHQPSRQKRHPNICSVGQSPFILQNHRGWRHSCEIWGGLWSLCSWNSWVPRSRHLPQLGNSPFPIGMKRCLCGSFSCSSSFSFPASQTPKNNRPVTPVHSTGDTEDTEASTSDGTSSTGGKGSPGSSWDSEGWMGTQLLPVSSKGL